jgi:hypothetical protein
LRHPNSRNQEPAAISASSARFHGRQPSPQPRACAHPGCVQPAEFRAPLSNRVPGDAGGWQWFCLDHVRAFNAGYNYFDGLSPDEVHDAQSPLAGWARTTTEKGREAFHFGDPHEIFTASERSGDRKPPGQKRWPHAADAKALGTLGLDDSASGANVKRIYKAMVRKYHPDSNGGDRTHEGKLQAVVAAYTHLRAQPRFKTEH